MPGRGGKGKSSKRSGGKAGSRAGASRELVLKTDDQVYGKVLKLLGDARMSVFCGDNVTRVCRVRGKMKNRVWVRKQDVVLVAKWAGFTSDDKADIIHKYTDDEVKTLRKRGEIPDKFVGEMEEPTVTTAATAKVDEDSDDDIVFEAADIDAI